MRTHPPAVALVLGLLTATVPTACFLRASGSFCVLPVVLGSLSVLLALMAARNDSPPRRQVVWIAVALGVVSVCFPCVTISEGNPSGPPIRLVLPVGYRGPICLLVDRSEGLAIPLEGGGYTYRIPASGILVIQDDGPFYQWHCFRAAYANGQPIPVDDDNELAADAVMLQDLGGATRTLDGREQEKLLFFVGTRAEVRAYRERLLREPR
jgi:hypothetical protein